MPRSKVTAMWLKMTSWGGKREEKEEKKQGCSSEKALATQSNPTRRLPVSHTNPPPSCCLAVQSPAFSPSSHRFKFNNWELRNSGAFSNPKSPGLLSKTLLPNPTFTPSSRATVAVPTAVSRSSCYQGPRNVHSGLHPNNANAKPGGGGWRKTNLELTPARLSSLRKQT